MPCIGIRIGLCIRISFGIRIVICIESVLDSGLESLLDSSGICIGICIRNCIGVCFGIYFGTCIRIWIENKNHQAFWGTKKTIGDQKKPCPLENYRKGFVALAPPSPPWASFRCSQKSSSSRSQDLYALHRCFDSVLQCRRSLVHVGLGPLGRGPRGFNPAHPTPSTAF